MMMKSTLFRQAQGFLLLCIGIHLFLPILIIGADPELRNENESTKIVGGQVAKANRYPWEVSIAFSKDIPTSPEARRNTPPGRKESAHHCDGILVDPSFVLTAAHCVVDLETRSPYEPPSQLQVGVGSNDLHEMFDRGRIPVTQIFIKEGLYRPGEATSPADIALIRLETPATDINTPDLVDMACLLKNPTPVYYPSPLTAIWFGNALPLNGSLASNGIVSGIQSSRYLKEIEVMDITPQASTGDPRAIFCQDRPDLICTAALKVPDSTCQGNSGGSLIIPTNSERPPVVGLASFGDSGLSAILGRKQGTTCLGPTSYTRISAHIEWIRLVLQSEICTV